jgi:hypothetical protein
MSGDKKTSNRGANPKAASASDATPPVGEGEPLKRPIADHDEALASRWERWAANKLDPAAWDVLTLLDRVGWPILMNGAVERLRAVLQGDLPPCPLCSGHVHRVVAGSLRWIECTHGCGFTTQKSVR